MIEHAAFHYSIIPCGLQKRRNSNNLHKLRVGLKSRYFVRNSGCFNCPLKCGNIHSVKEELLQIGERVYNLERIYNISADKDPDVLPERLFKEDLDDALQGGIRMSREDFEKALKLYYQNRQWDELGNPTPAKLSELGLKEFKS